MNDTQRKQSRVASRNEAATEKRTKQRRAYQRPEVVTYDSKTIMQAVGPAHGIYGTVLGLDHSM
jgi:hypothetical protein